MEVSDKYSGAKIGEVTLEELDRINEKISRAAAYFETFKSSSFEERKQFILTIVNTLKRDKAMLTKLISQEAGKPLFYAEGELDRCIRTAELGLEYFDALETKRIEINLKGTSFTEGHTQRFPVGIIFGISPFNFPLNLALHKIIPAIASGNTVIIKPSPYTPLSLIHLVNEVNKTLPSGLLTVVNCSNEHAEYIVKHPLIKHVSFTGSDQVGWHIKSLIPKKKVTLELGGNAAVYVDQNYPLEGLAETIAQSTALYAGQICISTQRILVHEAIYDSFKEALIRAFNKLTSGDPAEDVTNGPLIDQVHLARLMSWIEEAVEEGGKLLTGGTAISEAPPILTPTLLESVSRSSKLYTEEAFGPVGILQKVAHHKEAADVINDSKYGLQAGVFTQNKQVEDYLFEHIQAGGIIINGVPGFRRDEMPYGGIKDSGLGREGIQYSIEEMTELKLRIR